MDVVAQARAILENLKDQGRKSAADTLAERMAKCEACDILVTKSVRDMPDPDLKKLLRLVEEGWHWFSTNVQIKITEHAVHRDVKAGVVNLGDKVQVVTVARDVAQMVAIHELDSAEFQPLQPSFNQIANLLLTQIARALRAADEEPEASLMRRAVITRPIPFKGLFSGM